MHNSIRKDYLIEKIHRRKKGEDLQKIADYIGSLRKELGQTKKECNNCKFKSIIGGLEQGTVTAEVCEKAVGEEGLRELIEIARECNSAKEWKRKFHSYVDNKTQEARILEGVFVVPERKMFLEQLIGSYHLDWSDLGGKNLFLLFEYKRKIRRKKQEIEQMKNIYKRELRELKKFTNNAPHEK